MAKITLSGLDEIDMQLSRLLDRGNVRRVVEAGAREAANQMRANIVAAGHVRTGDMLESVRPGEYRESMGGGEMSVYPQDADRKGVANALKAYAINYGRGKRTRRMGDKFITGKLEKTEAVVKAAMEAESERILAEINK